MDIAFQGHKFKLKSKKMSGVKEYSPVVGWLLSLFNLCFKTLDAQGRTLYINRTSFCRWLLDQENEERIKEVSKQAFDHVLHPSAHSLNKKTARLDLPHVLKIFNREMSKLQMSMGGHTPNLHMLYEVMKEELNNPKL